MGQPRQKARAALSQEQVQTILTRAKLKENYSKIAADYPGLSAACISSICISNGLRVKKYSRPKNSKPAPVIHKVPTLGARIRLTKENIANLENQLSVAKTALQALETELNDAMEA